MTAGFAFEASWGGVRIDVLSTNVRHGRAVVMHDFPKRDGADLEDMGRDALVADLEFVFIDHSAPAPGELDYQARFGQFNSMCGSGETRTLVHPYLGSVRCKISAFSHRSSADEQPAIYASATVTEDISVPPVFTAQVLSRTLASAQAVRGSAAQAEASLAAAGLSSTAPSAAAAAAEQWESDPTLTTREVQRQMATLHVEISADLDELSVEGSVEFHLLHQQYTMLQYHLRRAAEAVTATSRRVVEITVREPIPLRVLAARFYGAAEAERRARELRELNPGAGSYALIAAGTVLKAYSRVR